MISRKGLVHLGIMMGLSIKEISKKVNMRGKVR